MEAHCVVGEHRLMARQESGASGNKRCLRALLICLALAVSPAAGVMQHPVGVRVGAHGAFGRVVFVVPSGVTATISTSNDHRLTVSMPGAGNVPSLAHGTLNVVSINGGGDTATLGLAPGSRPVLWQTDGKVVLDIYGPGTRPTPAGDSGTAPQAGSAAARIGAHDGIPDAYKRGAPATGRPAEGLPGRPSAPQGTRADGRRGVATSAQSASDVVAQLAPATPVAVAPLTAPADGASLAQSEAAQDALAADGLVAARIAPESIGGGDAILVPFDRSVGAAAFSRGGLAHVIFDDGKPVDTAMLKDDPVFASARITLLPAATHMTMRLPPGKRLSLLRRADGWMVSVVPQGGALVAARVQMNNGVVSIGTPFAGETVVMDDPATAGRLLVGTVRGPGGSVVVPHFSPEFSLLTSWAGVLVAAGSDRLTLRAAKTGFTLATAGGPRLVAVIQNESEQALADASGLTRHFDFMPIPTAMLRTRLTRDVGNVARSPKLGRFAPRLRVAQDMLALGLGREAASLLRMAVQDDPDQAQNADGQGLLAMAEWMDGTGNGAGLAAPALGGSDEMAFWRAVTQPAVDAKAAATLADTWRLLLAYPQPMRRRLFLAVVDMMLGGGQRAAATALMARVPDSSLDPERAEALRADGKTDEALALLDKVARGRDRKQAATAFRDAVELRLASGKMLPAKAADELDKHLYAWRDDALEADQRLRIAALRSQAGAWRPALSMLRETGSLYPSARDRVDALQRQVIADLLASSAASRLSPLDLVALVEENADLLAEKGASDTLAPVLVDKLLALDLPERADPILGKLMEATQAPEAKAGLGARLAALRIDQGDSAGAKAALARSDAASLPDALNTHRAVLQARALVLDGAEEAALSALASVDSPEALELRAHLLEKRQDWHGAENVLHRLVQASLPEKGGLTDVQQDLVLRLASAASEAGDVALMQQLQSGDATRLDAGPRAELFQALATRPVQGLADLPRSAREAVAASVVPAALASYDSR